MSVLADSGSDGEQPLFPFDARNYLGTALCLPIAMLAAGAGLGGGPLFLPLLIIIVGFSVEYAIPVSKVWSKCVSKRATHTRARSLSCTCSHSLAWQAMILGVSLAQFAINVTKRNPANKETQLLIDYNMAALLEPFTLLGTMIGVFFNVLLPSWFTVLSITLLLLIITSRTTINVRTRCLVHTSVGVVDHHHQYQHQLIVTVDAWRVRAGHQNLGARERSGTVRHLGGRAGLDFGLQHQRGGGSGRVQGAACVRDAESVAHRTRPVACHLAAGHHVALHVRHDAAQERKLRYERDWRRALLMAVLVAGGVGGAVHDTRHGGVRRVPAEAQHHRKGCTVDQGMSSSCCCCCEVVVVVVTAHAIHTPTHLHRKEVLNGISRPRSCSRRSRCSLESWQE